MDKGDKLGSALLDACMEALEDGIEPSDMFGAICQTMAFYFALVPEEGRGHTADLLKAEIPKFVDLAARMETRFRDPDVFNAEAMDSAS